MSSGYSIAGRYGGLKSWGNTRDRAERTEPARNAAPSSVQWHLDRLDPERFANATDEQKLAAAEAARRAYFAGLAMKSAKARRQGGGEAA